MVKILLTGNTHIMPFNSPRHSRHTLIKSKSINKLKRVWRAFEGLSLWRPIKEDYQLIHSFNGIPYTNKPFIVTTESFLPRTLGYGGDLLKNILRERLILGNCQKIIAMSNYAVLKFSRQNSNWHSLNTLLKKVNVIPPNIPIKASQPKNYLNGQTFQIIFVGGHFARKGGIVALRVAKKAKDRGLPIVVNIVSRLELGSTVYTDCQDESRYKKDIELLELDNVVLHGHIKNQEVLQLLEKSHLQILTTLDDTYGFSLIEGFAVATPAITTNVCALPEFVHHGKNGYILDLELNQYRNWVHIYLDEYRDWIYQARRTTDEYWEILDTTYESLAEQALELIVKMIDNPDEYESLSAGALSQAINFHNSYRTNELLDDLYSEVVGEIN
ncbi:glycosyltransferase family 4 protein [Nostoc sp. CMAA1605]|uniref:glycosyltransferase family 4 protein n=1 Tax=Nostoc sp. CMAA1605 TaxID=2055159 RepID=UPI001F2EE04D|nr:glycosyltransferase family 4 protein [Nostoc sp. CMAA1605]MCF4970311.1 group 1 glycosyl transferase [Nostoc sp. CMAA1605]